MAYDLPFVSKARKNIGKLPGPFVPNVPPSAQVTDYSFGRQIQAPLGQQYGPFPSELQPTPAIADPFPTATPAPVDPVGPMGSSGGFGGDYGQEFASGWDVPNPTFTDEQGQLLTSEEIRARDDARIPSDPFLAVPTSRPEPANQFNTVVEESPYTARQSEVESGKRNFGRLVEDVPHHDSIMFNTQVNERNPWSYEGRFEQRPGDLFYTGVPAIDEGVGVFRGLGGITLDFLDGPLFWPEEILAETIIDTVQLGYKSLTSPLSLDYGDIPTLFTEGPFAAKTEFDKRPIWQQLLGLGGIGVAWGAGRKAVKGLRELERKIPTVNAYDASQDIDPYHRLGRDADGNVISRADEEAMKAQDQLARSMEEAGLPPTASRGSFISSVASGANIPDREIFRAATPTSRAIPVNASDEALEAANDLDEAVLDNLREKLDGITTNVDDKVANEKMLDGNNVLGLRGDIPLGQSDENVRVKMWRKVWSSLSGQEVQFSDELMPLFRHAEEKRMQSASMANDLSAQFDYVARRRSRGSSVPIFAVNDSGLIDRLAGIDTSLPKFDPALGNLNHAPSLQDVAARLDTFRPHLTAEQLEVLETLRSLMEPWKKLLDDSGIDMGSRRDVTGTGFYIPRGDAKEISEEIAHIQKFGRAKAGEHMAKKGFERAESFQSMAHGVAGGYEYSSIGSAVRSYINGASERVINQNLVDQLKRIVDADGVAYAETSSMRFERQYGPLKKKLKALRDEHRRVLRDSLKKSGGDAQLGKEIAQAMKSVEKRVGRWSTAAGKMEKYQVLAADAEKAVDVLVEAGAIKSDIAREITKLSDELKAGGRQLDKNDAELLKKYKKIDDESESLRSMEGDLRDGNHARNYFAAMHRIEASHDEIDELLEIRDQLSAKVEDLLEQKEFWSNAGEAKRKDEILRRRLERSGHHNKIKADIAKAELKVLEKEQARALREVASMTKRQLDIRASQVKNGNRLEALEKRIDDAKESLDKAAELTYWTPKDRARIDIQGMGQYDFPAQMANALNRAADRVKPASGDFADIMRAIQGFNRMYLGFKATGDDGVLLLQGLAGMAGSRSPAGAWVAAKLPGVTYGRGVTGRVLAEADKYLPGARGLNSVMKMHFQSWSDPHVLGAFLMDFNRKANSEGLPLSYEWEKFGLRIGGSNTEFALTAFETATRATARPFGIPVGKGISKAAKPAGSAAAMFNRAFGYYGDSRRLTMAQDMMMEEKARLRSPGRVLDSGDMERIAEIANNMTGWSKYRAGGSAGDLALLAPRFFAARFETLRKAAMGLVPVSAERTRVGHRLDQKMARRTMLRLVTQAAATTYMVNQMQGKDTDFRPIVMVNGKPEWNSDFMVMHVMGHRIKLLGTYDSLARFITTIGTAAIRSPFDTKGSFEDMALIRGMTSGAVNNTWDFLQGENYDGTPTRDSPGDILKRLGNNFVSISMENGQEYLRQAGRGISTGDWDTAATGVSGVALEFFNAKNSPENTMDIRQQVLNEYVANATEDQMKELLAGYNPTVGEQYLTTAPYHYSGLSSKVQNDIIDSDLRVQEAEIKASEKRAKKRRDLDVALNERFVIYNEDKVAYTSTLKMSLEAGISSKDRRIAVQDYLRGKHDSWARLFKTPEMLDHMKKDDARNTMDFWRDKYFSIPLEVSNLLTLKPDYASQGLLQDAELSRAQEALGEDYDKDTLISRHTHEDPVIDAALKEYDADQKTLRSYWEIEDQVIARYPASVQREWKRLSRMPAIVAAAHVVSNPLLKDIKAEIDAQKIVIRDAFPKVDMAYVRQGYGKPRTAQGGILAFEMLRDAQMSEQRAYEGLDSPTPPAEGVTQPAIPAEETRPALEPF